MRMKERKEIGNTVHAVLRSTSAAPPLSAINWEEYTSRIFLRIDCFPELIVQCVRRIFSKLRTDFL